MHYVMVELVSSPGEWSGDETMVEMPCDYDKLSPGSVSIVGTVDKYSL